MTDKPKQPRKRDGAILSLDVAIGLVNIGKEASSMTPAPAVFGVATILLTTIRDKLANEQDCVDLGVLCAGVCDALRRGTVGKRRDELTESVRDAINRLEESIHKIQQKVEKLANKNELAKYLIVSNIKGKIAGWRSELNEILQVFNTELALNTNTMVADIHALTINGGVSGKNRTTKSSVPRGELPPPPPKVFFGRDELVQRIVRSAEGFTSIALIGTGGLGKTSITLTVLDDHRIKQRFGNNRSFIHCDRLTPSHTHFLQKLSEAIGADIKNPEDLSPLRRHLSSKEMIIVLDNAESILGLPETNAQEIVTIVDELSQFGNICLIITSRISNALPSHCEIIEIPTLSMDAGHKTFYRIYKLGERSDKINNILKELDFHPLSITLLATVAQQNRWDARRLTMEWERQRIGVLRARNLGSLAATVELSLASPIFQELGPNARGILRAIAFFPQGIDENNVNRVFPTISNGRSMFDTFCILSLTYRGNGFITMLAPFRDYLRPEDPKASPLLHMAKEHYFGWLSVELYPGKPGFNESEWIMSEDVNVEHLLDVFTSIDADSRDVWDACDSFMHHLFWHKPRTVILGSKVEALPNGHPCKPRCLVSLSRLFAGVGNHAEHKRLLIQSLGLRRERGDDYWVADSLAKLSYANLELDHRQGIQQAREALEIFGRHGDAGRQAQCLINLTWLLRRDKQFDAAEEAASRAMDLSENRDQYCLFQSHYVLGDIHRSEGDRDKALHHFEASLRIASFLNLRHWLSVTHLSLAHLYAEEDKYSDAHAHIEHAKSLAGNDMPFLGQAFAASAGVMYVQRRFKEAKLEASRALDIFEKLGRADQVEHTRRLLERIEVRIKQRDRPDTKYKR